MFKFSKQIGVGVTVRLAPLISTTGSIIINISAFDGSQAKTALTLYLNIYVPGPKLL